MGFIADAAVRRGAATAERAANQDRQRSERSEVIQWREVLAAKLVGGENQTRPARGTAQRAAMPLNHSHGDLRLIGEGGHRISLRKDKVEIGNSACKDLIGAVERNRLVMPTVANGKKLVGSPVGD